MKVLEMKGQANRRDFLLASAAAASSRLGAAAEPEIRTAFIGVGVRGGNLLRQVLIEDNVKITAICDIDPQTRDKALSAASRHSPRSFTEWRQVVDLKDVDAVMVATPCDLHAEMAAACLEAGKYVYCEKPLGITPEQVDSVLKASRRSKTFLQIGQQLRYFPTMREAIGQIHKDGIIGRPLVVRAQRDSGGGRAGSRAAEETPQQRTRRTWYADVKHSGDLIVENAVHNIDACNWITDSRPVSAYGHGKKYLPTPLPAGTVMMDGFSVEYIYENDMHVDYSQLTFHPRQLKEVPGGMWYVVFGEKGSVFLTHSSAMFYDGSGEAAPRNMVSPATIQFIDDLKRKGFGEGDFAMNDFYACIREKRQPFADIRVAATAALTAIMGREAIYKRRSVTWKELGVEV
jgi:myo-inositol 2-dehydrogenase/D-chiro-inositol 1-dehydrogenase